jgi:hypothetical protein
MPPSDDTGIGAAHHSDFDPGRKEQMTGYTAFVPAPVIHGWGWDEGGINALFEEATRALVELDVFSQSV